MKKLIFSLFIAAASFSAAAQDPTRTTLHLIGDSTMSIKPNLYYPERGWGMTLPGFMSQELEILNHAANGRSTKRFIDEGRWGKALSEMKEGDYVLIQFGHNDQKKEDPARYASAEKDYPAYLHRYIKDVREKGATPMIASSICRRHFDEQGNLKHTLDDYVNAARDVAEDEKVAFFDMNKLTCDYFEQEGDAATVRYFLRIPPGVYTRYPDGKNDDTHLNTLGAAVVAQFFIKDLKAKGHPLAKYVYRETL